MSNHRIEVWKNLCKAEGCARRAPYKEENAVEIFSKLNGVRAGEIITENKINTAGQSSLRLSLMKAKDRLPRLVNVL